MTIIAVFIRSRNVTDGQTDRIAISISRVSVLTRDKTQLHVVKYSLRVQKNFALVGVQGAQGPLM